MRKIISLICILLPVLAYADEVTIRENAPDRYVVVKGDTLWDISNKFFKDPWKWPQIWGINKENIKDPHWIYPGNIVYLNHLTKTLDVVSNTTQAVTTSNEVPLVLDLPPSTESTLADTSKPDVKPSIIKPRDAAIQKLSPKIRVLNGERDAISTIPSSIIEAFLNKPLLIEEDELENAPTLIGSVENRSLLSFGDTAFATGISYDKGAAWQIYRPGKSFVDPETDETLGYEAIYLGEALVQKFDEISTLKITKSILDILKGDHFIQTSVRLPNNYIPRSPSSSIKAKVISIYGGVDQAGQNSIITINKGLRDGLENGHVLALFKESEVSKHKGDSYVLPSIRYGLAIVFRAFNKVAYALVLEVQRPVQIMDSVESP